MIVPTIGRVVWYKRSELSKQFLSASIAYVHSETCVNLGFLTQAGDHNSQTSVILFQGHAVDCPEGQCCWMPYQQKVAQQNS